MSKNRSPDSAAQLLLFLDVMRKYDDLVSILPPPEKVGDNGQRHDPRALTFKAVLLRKFNATTDNMYLPKVTKALENIRPGSLKDPDYAEIILGDAKTGYRGMRYEQDRQDVPLGDLVTEMLYGIHVHGDYEKWFDHRTRVIIGTEIALSSWVHVIERGVHDLRDFIQGLINDGDITLGDPPTPNGR